MIIRLTCILIATLSYSKAPAREANDGGWIDNFPIDSYTMASSGKNPYWGLKPGRFVVMASIERDSSEYVLITVLNETEMVGIVETRVIEEREYKNGKLIEVSRNFFAMARETNDVFYFGEDVDDYLDGEIVGHGGQWRAGTDGARAGLFMPGKPVAGTRFYMEYHPGVAMDRAEIYETNATVETPAGTFDNVLIVTESSPLEPGDESYKRYASGVGMIYDDGLELHKSGRRFPSEKFVEFKIVPDRMPAIPTRLVQELHPTGVIREVQVEVHQQLALYAVETFIDGKQWDVLVTDYGEVIRNSPD